MWFEIIYFIARGSEMILNFELDFYRNQQIILHKYYASFSLYG